MTNKQCILCHAPATCCAAVTLGPDAETSWCAVFIGLCDLHKDDMLAAANAYYDFAATMGSAKRFYSIPDGFVLHSEVRPGDP